MTLKQEILDDRLTVFLDTDEYAETFTWNSTTITGLFHDPFSAVSIGEVEAESLSPVVRFRPENIVGIAQGDSVTRIANSIVYSVTGIQPDGRGWTLITLSQD